MCKIEIKDFNTIQINDEMYGGNGGNKYGFTKSNGENWFLKLPKDITRKKGLLTEGTVYSNSIISEFIGSKIYECLGFPVHRTELGIFREKMVCACQDFRKENETLFEIKNLFNNTFLNVSLNQKLESLKTSISSVSKLDLLELLFLMRNGVYKISNYDLEERFWDMFVIDSFISNQDRHNGNWGILRTQKQQVLSPIFDNGASFFPKTPDDCLSLDRVSSFVSVGDTPYSFKGKGINSRIVIQQLSLESNSEYVEWGLVFSILKNVPKIEKNIDKIMNLILSIPSEYKGQTIITPIRKAVYAKILEQRFQSILQPIYLKSKSLVLDFLKQPSSNDLERFFYSVPALEELEDSLLKNSLKNFLDKNQEKVYQIISKRMLEEVHIVLDKHYGSSKVYKEQLNTLIEERIRLRSKGALKEMVETFKLRLNNFIVNTLKKERKIFFSNDLER